MDELDPLDREIVREQHIKRHRRRSNTPAVRVQGSGCGRGCLIVLAVLVLLGIGGTFIFQKMDKLIFDLRHPAPTITPTMRVVVPPTPPVPVLTPQKRIAVTKTPCPTTSTRPKG